MEMWHCTHHPLKPTSPNKLLFTGHCIKSLWHFVVRVIHFLTLRLHVVQDNRRLLYNNYLQKNGAKLLTQFGLLPSTHVIQSFNLTHPPHFGPTECICYWSTSSNLHPLFLEIPHESDKRLKK
jgi:hypothetical protein